MQQRMHKRNNKKNGATTAQKLIMAGVVTSTAFGAWQASQATAAPAASAAPATLPVALPDSTAFIDGDANLPPLPVEYVPLKVIEQDRKRRAALPKAVRDQAFMQPLLDGKPLPPTMQTLPGAQPLPAPLGKAETISAARVQTAPKANNPKTTPKTMPKKTANSSAKSSSTATGPLLAQAIPPRPPAGRGAAGAGTPGARPGAAPRFPQPTIAPFAVSAPRTPQPTIPTWVRYPLEFQLCGIGIGTRAVDKDQYNRIDRYGLFAMHGNPTAVVVPTGEGGVTIMQTPPEVAALFPQDQDSGLPNWAAAITVGLDNNHVAWLYNRETYAMSFIVDRLGFVDAIVVAGTYSPIAKTQLEDPLHTVQLGDDLRKVLFRYGYPDTLETYSVQAIAGAGVATAAAGAGTGAGAGGEGSGASSEGAAPPQRGGGNPEGGAPAGGSGSGEGSGGGEGGAGGGAGLAGNAAFRTFELRYEQSYNVVFTIRDNRVVRIYIFGDPDFFNLQRRRSLRTNY